MSDPNLAESPAHLPGREEEQTALFAQLVMQQANMAMLTLGKTPHPETGKYEKNIEAATFFIDLLEMLEAKTSGNLTKEEAALLKQTLMSLRLAFVEAVESAPAAAKAPETSAASEAPSTPPPAAASPAPTASGPGPAAEEEHRKKFTKKY